MEDLIRDWGYIVLFLYSLGGGFVALVIATVLSTTGDLNLYLTFLVAGVANFLGDNLLFYMTRQNSSYTKELLNNHRRKLAYSSLLMKKYGWLAIFIQKYIYGVKTLIPIAIALTKYNFRNFIFFNFFATIVWVAVVGSISYMLGDVIINAQDDIKNIMIGIVIAIVIGVYLALKRI